VSGFVRPESGLDVGRFMQLSMCETDDLQLLGRIDKAPHLTGPAGGFRTGALLTMIDSIGGLGGGLAALPDGWVVSTNLSARVVGAAAHTGPLRIDNRLLRRGRNNVVTQVQVYDEGARDALVASGVLTSAILVPENGPPQWDRPLRLEPHQYGPDMERPPIPDWIGLRRVEGAPDEVEIELQDALRNPWGILHGGVVAMLVDLAAEQATGGRTTDVVLHFLAPNRLGPVRASTRVLGRRSDGDVVRVEVRDEGARRTTALAIATCAPSA
jgi:uncharacterized protein (TIGR00369 family)